MLAAASCGAFAADSVDLKIVGTIVPPSCTPTLSGGGTVDYGNIPVSTISNTGFTNLGTKSVQLSITCDAATKVAIRALDGRAGTAAPGAAAVAGSNATDSNGFGLGSSGGKQVGAYILKQYFNPSADGNPVARIRSDDNGVTWVAGNNASDGLMKADGSRIQSIAPSTSSTAPGAYIHSVNQYDVTAVINKRVDLPDLKQQVLLDGLATFSLVYL
ncbi:DUF1120 domain-containing protein [Paraburkholderia sp. GAS334]|uniref:DUF1120 domain-containing protein n=1 Tax=Paraburkholderia sp. GAS334 TaxID=3035131 RepID=UPI003D22166D